MDIVEMLRRCGDGISNEAAATIENLRAHVNVYERCGFEIRERDGERFVRGHGKEYHAE